MLLLAVAVGLGQDDGVDVPALLTTVGLALAFLAFFALGGTRHRGSWRAAHACCTRRASRSRRCCPR
jgi:hypothetical protein